jgi:hypothetical protein
MFGYAAFAQPTFAGLSGALYVVDVLEGFNVSSVEDGLRTSFGDVLEVLVSGDSSSSVFAASVSIVEALVASESITSIGSFVGNVSENINSRDLAPALRTQFALQAENINLLETPLGFAWIKIDNTESTQWVLIDNRQ